MPLRYPHILIFSIFYLLICAKANAQSKRIVYFKDKGNNSFSLSSPSAYLSPRAINRRNKYGIKPDSSDLPVPDFYTDSLIRLGNIRLLGRSKWLNAVLLQSDDSQIWDRIRNISFIQKIEEAALRISNRNNSDKWKKEFLQPLAINTGRTSNTNGNFQYGAGAAQINIHNGSFLHRLGATGSPMLFSFMDAGYNGYLSNPFLDSARNQNRIIATRDFVSGDNNVNEDNQHGLNCLSVIAGYQPGSFVGSCPNASFILLRTEDAASEYLIEEFNWTIGAEYADSCGTDIISSSLSYTTFDLPTQDHRYSDMDGNTTIITRAADLAAKKGILVATSAGNDGGSAWKFIGAPADADSVLTVGAVNASGIIAGFSSFGPTADMRIKPDVVGMGVSTVLSNGGGGLSQASGTSFSTPVLAGLAGCLWQLFPEMNNIQIIKTLQQSSDRYKNPIEQYGYGIPDMRKAVGLLLSEQAVLTSSLANCKLNLNWSSKDIKGMRYLIERKSIAENNYKLIHEINATGSSFLKRNYSYNENQPAGNYSYKVSQVIDTSGSVAITVPLDSITVVIPTNCPDNQIGDVIQVYPNPAVKLLTLKFNRIEPEEDISLRIVSINGESIFQKTMNKPAGYFTLEIPISQLQTGMYSLEIRKGKKLYASKKFIKSGKD
jgi:serine protease AprX